MHSKCFIDTSVWLAYSIPQDINHKRAVDILKNLFALSSLIYTSNDVVDESVTRLAYTTHSGIVSKFVVFFKEATSDKSIEQLWVTPEIQEEAFRFLNKYSDHKLSLTDATTAVLVKRFHIDKIITFDSDFTKIGLSTLP